MAIRKLPNVTRFLILFFLYEFAFVVYPAIWAYFTQERFGWGPSTVGLSLASFGISIAFVQGFLIRWIIPKLGEARTIFYGLIFNLMGFLFLSWVEWGLLALLFTPITAFGAIVTPALQGLISRSVGDDEQGELQGLLSSTRAIAMIFSPLVMTQIFWYFTRGELYLPGAPFLLSGALIIVGLIVFQGHRDSQKT